MNPLRFHVMPGHCLAIMLAAWRGQSLVPAANIAGLDRSLRTDLHPELVAIEVAKAAAKKEKALAAWVSEHSI